MGMFDRRKDHRIRSGLPVQIEWMAPFVNAPAIIRTAHDETCNFPKVLPIFTKPYLTCFAIGSDAPWIPQAIRPRLGPHSFTIHKRIVFRDGISFSGIRMIDVDPQDLGS